MARGFVLVFLLSCFNHFAVAEQSTVLRKLAVFPILGASGAEGEEAWWTVRDLLTAEELFLVASRRLMMNRGVFQPRGDLNPADRIILGKILEAEALIVMYLENRQFVMKVYSGVDGVKIWEKTLELHPAMTVAEQVVKVATQMTLAFLRDVPYRGALIKDDLSGKVTWQVGEETLAWVHIGKLRGVGEGDNVNLVAGTYPFSLERPWRVVAQGVVQKMSDENPGRVLVKIQRKNLDLKSLKEGFPVQFPDESVQVEAIGLTAKIDGNANLSNEYLSSELREQSDLKNRPTHDSTSSVLAWLGHISLLVLLAF